MPEYIIAPGAFPALSQVVEKLSEVSLSIEEVKDCLDRIQITMNELRGCSSSILHEALQEDNDRFLDELQSDLTIIAYAIQKAQTNMKG